VLDQIRTTLRFSRSGQFYVLNGPLDANEVTRLFNAAVADQDSQYPAPGPLNVVHGPSSQNSNIEFREVRGASRTFHVENERVELVASVFIRSFAHSPLFAPKSGLVEHSYGYLILIEATIPGVGGVAPKNYLFVHRDGAVDPMKQGFHGLTTPIDFAAFLEQFLSSAGTNAAGLARIERLAMRMMATSQGEVRQKVIDSHDVEASTSSLGLHRTIAGSFTLTRQKGSKSEQLNLSPHKYSVRVGTSRVTYDALLNWVASIALGFSETVGVATVSSPFLAQMAQPLLDLVGKVPSSLFIERHRFSSSIQAFCNQNGRSWIGNAGTPAGWGIDDILDQLSDPLRLNPAPRTRTGAPLQMVPLPKEAFYFPDPPLPLYAGNDGLYVRVTSRTCSIHLPKGVGHLVLPGINPDPMALHEVLNESKAFRVVFEAGSALYCSEGAFRSSNVELATTQLKSILRGVVDLGHIVTEKGSGRARQVDFDATSSFSVIENCAEITSANSILICDDATNEWCDFLELDQENMRIQWIHSKVQRIETRASRTARAAANALGRRVDAVYGPMSLGSSLSASDLQEVVGQATKNLSKLRVSTRDPSLLPRCNTWLTSNCTLLGPAVIQRMRRGAGIASTDLVAVFDATAGDPNANYEVAILVPNYSVAGLSLALDQIALGNGDLNVIQAFWLLSGFMHACLDVGAKPIVFMQP
jgi:hypothetical protein